MKKRTAFFKIILGLLFLAGLPVTGVRSVAAQSIATNHSYTFDQEIKFQAQVQAETAVEKGLLFLMVEGEPDTREIPVTPGPEGLLEYTLQPADQPVRAFSNLTYWFEVQLADGTRLASEQASFQYDDNRFSWQTREASPFRVHWIEGDVDFAQNALDVVKAGLQRVQSLAKVDLPQAGIDIYIYGTAAEMQAALNLASQDWVAAGHADPELGVIVVNLPPGPDQRLLMEQRLPHELMHILLYQKMGPTYANLPTWLNEGLASNAELYPNPDYLVLLTQAVEKDGLLPMTSLCKTFPRDASSALLAYAQATSFTRFLHEQYGSSGLERIMVNYADGLDCERGIAVALESDLPHLEKDWRRVSFGENPLLSGLKRLTPWLVLLLVIVAVPVGLVLVSLVRKPGESERPVKVDRYG